MKTKTFKNAPVFSLLQNLAVTIQTESKESILSTIAEYSSNPLFAGVQFQSMFYKLSNAIAFGKMSYDIFKLNGNEKLPFVAFSSLPGVTCPGAGDCLAYCYSFRAWRYPHAFGRMAQNAYFMRNNKELIVSELARVTQLDKFKSGFDLRLYVDGDFSSNHDVAFWFDTLKAFPTVRAYGYSKSFDEILSYKGEYPSNYVLNVSGGHSHSAGTVARVLALPITRGMFIAVPIGKKVVSADHGTRETNAALREAFGAKAFTCPGACGTCTAKAHACGSMRFKHIPVIIAVH